MANLRKKTIRTWDGGVKTTIRDSSYEVIDGAQMVRHFDIFSNPDKLTPMPSWTDFATDAEKIYNIRAVGGYTDTIYGIGSALSNWYGKAWNYRVKVTPNTTLYTASGLPLHLDLSDMPAGFWSNTNSDGSDIRVTNHNHEGIAFEVENFNQAGNTGDLWVDDNFTGYFYVYYGNATADAIASSGGFANQTQNVWDSSNMRFAFTFPEDVKNRNTVLEEFTTEPTYVAGSFGKAITTSDTVLTTDSDDEVALTANEVSISFMIYLDSAPTAQTTIIKDNLGYFSINVRTDRKLEIYFNGSSGTTTSVAASALSTGQWYVIDVVFNNHQYLYTNGVVETFTVADGDYDGIGTNTTLLVTTANAAPTSSNFCKLAQIWGFDNDLTQAQVTNKYNNFTNASFWTIAAQEAKSDISLNYTGTQVYTKSLSSGDWEEMLEANQPVKNLDYYPVNSFVEISGDVYFITSSEPEDGGFTWLAKTSSLTGLVANHLLLTLLQDSNKMRPIADSPVDKTIYFNFGTSAIGSVGDPGTTSEFAAYSTVISMSPWRNFLAIGSSRRTRANVELWDLVQANPVEFIDAGIGNLRVVGNASDILFAVVDNYIDDEVLSSGKPSMDIMQYAGNGRMDNKIKIEVPSTYTGWSDDWERAVSFFKIRRSNETLFYAKLPADDSASTFNEGFWAVGKNSRGELALTLMLDTSDLNPPESVHGFAQQVFYVEKDGGIQRLSTDGSYDKTSLFKSLKMNEGNSEILKKLHGVEIVTEPLEDGQTVSLYYTTESVARTKIADFTGTGEISAEYLTDNDGNSLCEYQEIEFDIESSGGGSSILEFSYKFEYLGDIV